MIRVVLVCEACDEEYSERFEKGETDVVIKREGWCPNCDKLESIFDLHNLRRGRYESHA